MKQIKFQKPDDHSVLSYPKGNYLTEDGINIEYEFNPESKTINIDICGICNRTDMLDIIDFLIAAEKEI
jgi:hypothetical protein